MHRLSTYSLLVSYIYTFWFYWYLNPRTSGGVMLLKVGLIRLFGSHAIDREKGYSFSPLSKLWGWATVNQRKEERWSLVHARRVSFARIELCTEEKKQKIQPLHYSYLLQWSQKPDIFDASAIKLSYVIFGDFFMLNVIHQET